VKLALGKIGLSDEEVGKMGLFCGSKYAIGYDHKNGHITAAMEACGITNLRDVTLIDDDIANITSARYFGCNTMYVSPMDNAHIEDLSGILDRLSISEPRGSVESAASYDSRPLSSTSSH